MDGETARAYASGLGLIRGHVIAKGFRQRSVGQSFAGARVKTNTPHESLLHFVKCGEVSRYLVIVFIPRVLAFSHQLPRHGSQQNML